MDSKKGLIQQKTEKVTLVFDYFSEFIKEKIIYTTNIFFRFDCITKSSNFNTCHLLPKLIKLKGSCVNCGLSNKMKY